MNLLEQLGITKEEMLKRITDSSVVDKNIKEALKKFVESMEGKITERIDALLNERIIEVFERSYQPIDRWWKEIGPRTTVRDKIMDMAESYWMDTVDASGQKADNYGAKKRRFEWAVERCVAETMQNEIRQSAQKLAADLKAKIPEAIGKEISETVVKYFK